MPYDADEWEDIYYRLTPKNRAEVCRDLRRRMWRSQVAYPVSLIITDVAIYILMAAMIAPDITLLSLVALQGGALSITVMFYGLVHLGKIVT